MVGKITYKFAGKLLVALYFFYAASLHAAQLDWDVNAWPAPVGGVPTLSQTYAIGGGNVTVTISGDTGALTTVPDGSPSSPQTNIFQTGGLVPAENCLFLRMNFPEVPPVNTQEIVVTYSFSHPGGVNVPSFTAFDLDFGSPQWVDQAVSTATLAAGGIINPSSIVTGAGNTDDGVNTVTGTGGAGNTSPDGNATFIFGQDGVSEYTFVYSNQVPNSGIAHNQWACMHDINFFYPPTVEKSFSPNSITEGDTSTLTITLGNPEATNAILSADLVDTLPANVTVASPANIGGTCPGTTNATAGGSTVTYTSGSVIPPGSCTITVDVTSDTPGTYTNTIPVGDLQTNFGNNTIEATDDLTVEMAPAVCPAGSTLTPQVGNAIVATGTGTTSNPGYATNAIEALGTNATTTNSARLLSTNDELILDLGEVVPTNGVVTISIARNQTAASVIIEDSEDGAAYSGGQIFNSGPNTVLQQINYVVTSATGARFIRFTNQNNSNMWVDGVEYSQICDSPPPPPPSCPAGTALTVQVGNAVLSTETGAVGSVAQAAGGIEALGTAGSGANSAQLVTIADELTLDLGQVVPTNSVVTISIARNQVNAIAMIEDSADGVSYTGGQLFGNGPDDDLQRIDYVVTAAAGARYIRFTNASTSTNANNMWVDGVEYSQVCTLPTSCPAGTTLTAQVGNAVSATETGNVVNESQATGAIVAVGTTAIAANSAELRNANDELILDLGELVPNNGVVTTSITRNQTNSVVLIENSEDGVAYSGGQLVNVGPNNVLQRIIYNVSLATGAQFIRITNQNGNDMWVDGVEYSEFCDAPDVVDLTITKDDGSATYTPGGTATYTIVVTNNGPDDVVGATIADDLPDGVTMTGPWTCTPSSASSSCNTAPNTTDPISIDVDIINGDFITVTIPVQFSTNMGDY